MRQWKSILVGAVLTVTSCIPSFAFDMAKDVKEWTPSLPTAVTLYQGMPDSDFKANFSDMESKGWTLEKSEDFSREGKGDVYTYKRMEPSKYDKNVEQDEIINVMVARKTQAVISYSVTCTFFCDKGYEPSQEVQKAAFMEIYGIANQLSAPMVQKYGAAPRRNVIKDQMHGEHPSWVTEFVSWTMGKDSAQVSFSVHNPAVWITGENQKPTPQQYLSTTQFRVN